MLHFSDFKHLDGSIWYIIFLTLFEDDFIFAHTYRITYFEFHRTRDLYFAVYRGQEFFSDRRSNVDGSHIDHSMLMRVTIWYKLRYWLSINTLSINIFHISFFNVRLLLDDRCLHYGVCYNNDWCSVFSRTVVRQRCKILFPHRSVDFFGHLLLFQMISAIVSAISLLFLSGMAHIYLLNT